MKYICYDFKYTMDKLFNERNSHDMNLSSRSIRWSNSTCLTSNEDDWVWDIVWASYVEELGRRVVRLSLSLTLEKLMLLGEEIWKLKWTSRERKKTTQIRLQLAPNSESTC